jgi:hypothetical protein
MKNPSGVLPCRIMSSSIVGFGLPAAGKRCGTFISYVRTSTNTVLWLAHFSQKFPPAAISVPMAMKLVKWPWACYIMESLNFHDKFLFTFTFPKGGTVARPRVEF